MHNVMGRLRENLRNSAVVLNPGLRPSDADVRGTIVGSCRPLVVVGLRPVRGLMSYTPYPTPLGADGRVRPWSPVGGSRRSRRRAGASR